MANVGRPRALDDVKRREVCALVSAGCGIPRAAQYVGCNPSTIRREALRNPEFHDDLRRAELTAELEPLRLLRQKAATHWRAAAWLLERVNPERFDKRDSKYITLDDAYAILEHFVDLAVEEIPEDALREKVFRGMNAGLKQLVLDARADRPRRNPHRRKNYGVPTTSNSPGEATPPSSEPADQSSSEPADRSSSEPADQTTEER